MARGWMQLGWVAVALTACLGLADPAFAQGEPAPAPKSDAPAGPPPGPQAAYGGYFMGLPCPPPGPQPPQPSQPPPCEGPTDNTQFNTPMFHTSVDYLH